MTKTEIYEKSKVLHEKLWERQQKTEQEKIEETRKMQKKNVHCRDCVFLMKTYHYRSGTFRHFDNLNCFHLDCFTDYGERINNEDDLNSDYRCFRFLKKEKKGLLRKIKEFFGDD